MSEHETVTERFFPKGLKTLIDLLPPSEQTEEKIEALTQEYKKEIVEQLVGGSSEASLPHTIKKLLDQVPLEKMDNFLERCPIGDDLHHDYVEFLSKLMREKIPLVNNYQKFVQMIFDDYVPRHEGWLYEIK